MEFTNNKLKKKIMRRVYGVWVLRQVAPAIVVIPFSSGFALWLTAKNFFVARIVENFITSAHNGGLFSASNFLASAFWHTPLMILIIGFLGGLALYFAYKLVRNFNQLSLVRSNI